MGDEAGQGGGDANEERLASSDNWVRVSGLKRGTLTD